MRRGQEVVVLIAGLECPNGTARTAARQRYECIWGSFRGSEAGSNNAQGRKELGAALLPKMVEIAGSGT